MLRNLEGWRGTTNRNLNAQLLTALWGWNELVRENRAEQAVGDDGLFLPTTTEALSLLSSESTTDGLLTPLEMDLPKHEEWVRLLTTEPSYENLITQLRKHRAHTRYFKSQISLQLLIALTLKPALQEFVYFTIHKWNQRESLSHRWSEIRRVYSELSKLSAIVSFLSFVAGLHYMALCIVVPPQRKCFMLHKRLLALAHHGSRGVSAFLWSWGKAQKFKSLLSTTKCEKLAVEEKNCETP